MLKVQLYCDVCRHACVEVLTRGTKAAMRAVSADARSSGWSFSRNIGWTCRRCAAKPVQKHLTEGEHAYYLGSMLTSLGHKLHGKRVKIIKRDDVTGTVHVIFDDKEVGRYAKESHWFFQHDFSHEPPEGVSAVISPTSQDHPPLVEVEARNL